LLLPAVLLAQAILTYPAVTDAPPDRWRAFAFKIQFGDRIPD
jgi:hypothetical protein